jgi:ankyrin repeat protein
LREAVVLDDLALARARLDAGDDPNTGEFRYHGPLLMIAAGNGQLGIVELLLDRGANTETTDDLGQTALLWAATMGQLAAVSLLLERGANLNGKDWSGQTPLAAAAVRGHRDIVDLLLERGAKRTLLDAVALDDVRLVEDLLKERAEEVDPNRDPLYYGSGRLAFLAVSRGNVEIAILLLDFGATLHHPRFDKHSLIAEAARCRHIDVVRLLLERGADPHAKGKDGKDALDLAIEGGHEAIVALLQGPGDRPTPDGLR